MHISKQHQEAKHLCLKPKAIKKNNFIRKLSHKHFPEDIDDLGGIGIEVVDSETSSLN